MNNEEKIDSVDDLNFTELKFSTKNDKEDISLIIGEKEFFDIEFDE